MKLTTICHASVDALVLYVWPFVRVARGCPDLSGATEPKGDNRLRGEGLGVYRACEGPGRQRNPTGMSVSL